jgi:hypothetical protein
MKRFIFLGLIFVAILVSFNVLAQSPPQGSLIQRQPSSNCVNAQNTFTFKRSGCTVSWSIPGNYTVIGSTSTSITIKWNAPYQGVSVTVNFTSCGSTPYSGSDYTSLFNIVSTPSAVISPPGPTKIKNVGGSLQFSATPTGTAYSYDWYRDGGTVQTGTQSTYTANTAGSYNVVVTNSSCSGTSANSIVSLNQIPTSNAGLDKSFLYPASTTTITGSGSDLDGTVASYQWSQVSGAAAILTNPNSATASLSNLKVGNYVFRLTVVDNMGDTGTDDVQVTVEPPPNNYNYVKSVDVAVPNVLQESDVDGLVIGSKTEIIQYVDGLGRPIQSVVTQGSPAAPAGTTGMDQVQPIIYDQYGREAVKVLPVVVQTNGFLKENILDATANYTGIAANFYNNTVDKIADDVNPYAKTIFEASPLNRVLKQGAPGQAWQTNSTSYESATDNTLAFKYAVNAESEVLLWSYSGPTSSNPLGLISAGSTTARTFYPANRLSKMSTKDENHNEVVEYKNIKGQVVLRKVQAPNNEWAETYYIYDDYNNLVCVLPPEAVKAILNNAQ